MLDLLYFFLNFVMLELGDIIIHKEKFWRVIGTHFYRFQNGGDDYFVRCEDRYGNRDHFWFEDLGRLNIITIKSLKNG